MSFLRFLAVGQSIDAVAVPSHRYRMSEPGSLPKFGRSQEEQKSKPAPRDSAISSKTFTGKQMSGHSIAGQTQRQAEGRSAGFWRCVRRLLNPQKRHRPGVAVQAALALDLIKPVCNDLADSDLELVPAVRQAPGGGRDVLWKRVRGRVLARARTVRGTVA